MSLTMATIYRIQKAVLAGTEIEPFLGMLLVRYPHRRTPDTYIVPMKDAEGKQHPWKCCQCDGEFEGDMNALVEHLMLHKGRLVKPWNRKSQLKAPIPAPPGESSLRSE